MENIGKAMDNIGKAMKIGNPSGICVLFRPHVVCFFKLGPANQSSDLVPLLVMVMTHAESDGKPSIKGKF